VPNYPILQRFYRTLQRFYKGNFNFRLFRLKTPQNHSIFTYINGKINAKKTPRTTAQTTFSAPLHTNFHKRSGNEHKIINFLKKIFKSLNKILKIPKISPKSTGYNLNLSKFDPKRPKRTPQTPEENPPFWAKSSNVSTGNLNRFKTKPNRLGGNFKITGKT
jgi:hypothetical protein